MNGSGPLEPRRGLCDGGGLLLRDPGVHFAEVLCDGAGRDREPLGEFAAAFQFQDRELAKGYLLQQLFAFDEDLARGHHLSSSEGASIRTFSLRSLNCEGCAD